MKHHWLEYSPLGYYVYWAGLKEYKRHDREEIRLKDAIGLLGRLDKMIDMKRKSLFHLVDLPESMREDFKNHYKNSKIKLSYE